MPGKDDPWEGSVPRQQIDDQVVLFGAANQARQMQNVFPSLLSGHAGQRLDSACRIVSNSRVSEQRRHRGAKPLMCRVTMIAFVPKLSYVDLRNSEGRPEACQSELRTDDVCYLRWQRCDRV